jgi:hypothetical protein
MTAQKSYDLGNDESTVLKFRGHPRYDAFRVENEAKPADVTVYVDTDDELENVDTNSATQVDNTTGLGAGSNYGTKASSRTVLVEIADNDGSDSDGPNGVVYAHDASDPAQNATAFASR